VVTVPGDHFVFLAPCPESLAEAFPTACEDPPGVERAAVHRQIAAELVDFFDRTLGPDAAPASD
jgi:predicted dienelactone hydrolase